MRGHAEVRSGGHPWATLPAQMVARRSRLESLGGLGGPSTQGCGPTGPTESNGDARQTLCPLRSGDMRTQKHMNHRNFGTKNPETKTRPEPERVKRYA